MPGLVSLISTPAAYATLNAAARNGTALSSEADAIRKSASAVVEWMEQSVALFGEKNSALSEIRVVAAEHAQTGWDGEGAHPVSVSAANRAEAFVRALPSGLPMPEVAPEPDGSISLDWIESRVRLFSISVGESDWLAYAWLDGTDQGHAVARFDAERIPSRILYGIRETIGHAAIRVA